VAKNQDLPTNHLDISAKEILKNALLNFDGTMIVVSHDREFLQDLTDKTYEFRNKTIKEYYGGINEFLTAKRVASFRDYESEKKQTEAKKEKEISVSKENYELRKEQEKTIKKIKNEIEKKEQLIASLEGKIAGMEKEMLNPDFFSGNNSAEGIKLHEKVKQELAREISRWETLIKDLESEEKKLTQQTL
jgi:ATP-binding cassette, subfamily F, member 3